MKGNIGSCRFQFNQKTTKMVFRQHCVLCKCVSQHVYTVQVHVADVSVKVVVVHVHTLQKRETVGDGAFSKTENIAVSHHRGQRVKNWHCLLSFPATKPDRKSRGGA
jgi:hypothetical protein